MLSQLLGSAEPFAVNSLHGQGIRETGPQLRVEARAPDGLVEAVSLPKHPFALAVQWHPEWHSDRDPVSRRLFEAFIHAAVCYHKEKQP
jgi:gamma-glutamyl-gamma-aminobutyrate hydrolase